MTTSITTMSEAVDQTHGRLVLNRGVGDGFSLGEKWRFEVLQLSARFVTLAVSGPMRMTRWQLEVDDSLQVTLDDTLVCSRESPAALATLEVAVARVTIDRATFAIDADRSLKITRHDAAAAHASAS